MQSLVAIVILSSVPAFAENAASSETRSAYDYMLEAHNARAVWHDFPGFTAKVVVSTDGNSHVGKITVKEGLEYELEIDDAARKPWVKSKLRSVISHRGPSEMSDKGYSFAQSSSDGPGVLIAQNDGSGVFRLVDGTIRDVLRKSETHWFEITNLDQFKTPEGTFLPKMSAVVYRDPASGDIQSQRSNLFTWTKVGGFFLPKRTLTIEVGDAGERTMRELKFSDHKLNAPLKISSVRSKLHRPLEEALTSFGAAVLGDYLYVFSGHDGDAHGFGRDNLSDHFRRIKYDDPTAEWEELARHEPAQSTALVSDGEFLYRIGGLSFLNTGNEETNFNSTTYFARYNPKTDEWTELAPLPEPRSSLDAAVIGRSIYVAAGWNLQGASSSDVPWHEDVLKFDLDHPESGWQSFEGPGYKTRAASVAAHDGKLYLLGGIQQRGITRKVSIYNPQTSEWSEGPELKADSSTAGFATSSFATGGKLYYTGGSGVVYRLADDGSNWEIADRLLFPRMFLRLLPLGENRLIALGGVANGGRTPSVESLQLDTKDNSSPKMARWSVPFNGRAKHSQTLVLDGTKLYAFGGNASASPHDFSEEAFVDEAFAFDLSRQSVEQLPNLPSAMQSGVGVAHSQTSEHHSILLLGGLGFRNDEFRALDEVVRFDPKSKTWSQRPETLPERRSMFAGVAHDDAIWLFGGQSVGEDREYQNSVLHWWGDESKIAPLPNISVPTPRRSFGGVVLQDEYYMVGGLAEAGGIAEQVDVFDLNTRTWRQGPSPTVPRVFPSLVSTKDKLYLFGGFTQADGHFAPATSLEVFDHKSQTWSTVADKIPGVEPSQTMLEMNGRLLFYGIDAKQKQANFVMFDPNPSAEPEVVAGMSFGRRRGGSDANQNAKLMLRKDTNKDGKLSREELGQRMTAFFDKADTNSDNSLTFDETVAALKADEAANDPGE